MIIYCEECESYIEPVTSGNEPINGRCPNCNLLLIAKKENRIIYDDFEEEDELEILEEEGR